METYKERADRLEKDALLIASAIIKLTSPAKDDVSENQAMKDYGGRWLRKMKRLGLAEFHRVGGKNVYSRLQLNSLREAEREEPQFLPRPSFRKEAAGNM